MSWLGNIERPKVSLADVAASRDLREKKAPYISTLDLRGLAVRTNAVFRISIRSSEQKEIGHGTGFLIAPDLAITNYHNLPDEQSRKMSKAQFFYEEGETTNY